MDMFAIDDSAQAKPSRDGMGPLVAVGGLHPEGERVRDVEIALDGLCARFGFPPGEELKWSPSRSSWMRNNLVEGERQTFSLEALAVARQASAAAIVVIEDTKKQLASEASGSHEEDVTMMFLERAHSHVARDRQALVVFDRPGGGQRAVFNFLAGCIDMMRTGTTYARLDRLALALSTDSKLSRLVQLADVIVASTTSFVSGETNWSPTVFTQGVLPLLREEFGRKGGCGLKIHPDFRYGNLYHWLLGDEEFFRFMSSEPLPSGRFTCYRESPDTA